MAKASSSHWDLAGHLRALGEAAALRPLGLVCFSSLSFTTQSLFVKLLGQSGLGSFQAIMVRGLFQMTGASCILLSWGTPVNSWLGNDRQQVSGQGALALFSLLYQYDQFADVADHLFSQPVLRYSPILNVGALVVRRASYSCALSLATVGLLSASWPST